MIKRIARARSRVRAQVWTLLMLRPGRSPWLTVAGKRPTGWLVIDMDAAIITAESKKQHAAATFKHTYGFHPLAACCANTTETLAMKLRPGNADANPADHRTVLAWALAQVPGVVRQRILVRIDGAGATHELTAHLVELSTTKRTVRYTVRWKITPADEAGIVKLPKPAWMAMLDQNGGVFDADLAEPTTVAQTYMFVGVATHARNRVYSILETATGAVLDTQTFLTTQTGLPRAAAWIARRTVDTPAAVLISMEGTGSFGRQAAAHLSEAGYRIVEALTPMRGKGRAKTDDLDAQRAARDLLGLPADRLRDHRTGVVAGALQVLTSARDRLSVERTATVTRWPLPLDRHRSVLGPVSDLAS